MDGSDLRSKWRLLWIFFFFCVTVLFLINYRQPSDELDINMTIYLPMKYPSVLQTFQENLLEFLLQTPGCRIPEMDPFDESVKKYIYKEKPFICNDNKPALVEANLTALSVINSSLKIYGIEEKDSFSCCYSVFKRLDPKPKRSDNEIVIDPKCVDFTESINVEAEFVVVKCFKNDTGEIYKDFFAFVPSKFPKNTRQESTPPKPLNILIAGLDGVSRLNLHRQMPNTVNVLKEELKAVEMYGYNKVGDNTFPNLIPILTGLTEDELVKDCWPKTSTYFDNCSFIWKDYHKKGFATSYAEDASWMGIFNYQKRGFQKQPTDYYWKTFSYIAEEEIGNHKAINNDLCIGSRPQYKILLDYVKNFVDSMKIYDKPFFNFFWSASLTHDYLNYPQLGDEEFTSFFRYLSESGSLNETALIFLSDHGIRWGGIRSTNQGMLEGRLPFIFVALPEWYKETYPMAYLNLRKNSRRLTTPFDLHETLKDLLEPYKLTNTFLKWRSKNRNVSRSYSLFEAIPENRTCELANISSHWCACQESIEIESNSTMAMEVAEYSVRYLNRKLNDFKECENLTLKNVARAKVNYFGKLSEIGKGTKRDFIISFVTVPGDAIFEVTVRQTFLEGNETIKTPYNFKVMGTISRLNLYGSQSACVSDFHIKLYCYCKT